MFILKDKKYLSYSNSFVPTFIKITNLVNLSPPHVQLSFLTDDCLHLIRNRIDVDASERVLYPVNIRPI